MGDAVRKPWDIPVEERLWRCEEHCADYGYSASDAQRGRGSITWECPFCAVLAEDAKKEWDAAWRRYQFWDRSSNIPFRFRTRTLASWSRNTKANEAIGAALDAYAADMDARIEAGAGAVLLGPPGVGKSHLLTALVAEAISRGYWARYFVWPDVITEIKNGFNLPREQERRDLLAILKEAPLLAIDELGLKPGATEFESGLLFELIDFRYRERLPTLVASNATREKFPALVGERIADRLGECSPALVLTGSSNRPSQPSPMADAGSPQIPEPSHTLTIRSHRSGDWREEIKTYTPPHRGY